MFYLDYPPVPYSDPWSRSFDARLAELAQGEFRIAYIYERADTSTFRYRVYNMVQALRGSGSGASYFFMDEDVMRAVELADSVVLCRTRYSLQVEDIANRAVASGKRLFFDIDDLVFDTRYVHLVLQTLDQERGYAGAWDHWFAYVARMGAALNLCDAAITTNDFLAERVRAFSDKPVHVIPNFLNQEQLAVSLNIYREKLKRKFERTEEVHIGYFSGTPTHNKDFGLVVPALAQLMEQDSRIRVRVVGYMDIPAELKRFGARVESYPLHDFINLQRMMGLVEINLIPLQDNTFTNSKSELKYFEAAAVGTISIASPTFVYATIIREAENGYLARIQEWEVKVATAIARLSDYGEVAGVAFEHATRNYAWYRQSARIRDVLHLG